MKTFKCLGYKNHVCGKETRKVGRNHKRCSNCAKKAILIYQNAYGKSPEGRAKNSLATGKYRKTSKGKEVARLVKKRYDNSPKGRFKQANSVIIKLLKIFNLSRKYDIRNFVLNRDISNKTLEKIAGGYGWPDFEKEALEEKGPKIDYLNHRQWARAILEYRAGRQYRVAWRFTSTRRKIFRTVFDFYDWQLEQREKQ